MDRHPPDHLRGNQANYAVLQHLSRCMPVLYGCMEVMGGAVACLPLTYTGLLYQDLLKSGQVKGKQKLPPVFPLVLYNGEKRWNAATSIADLIAAAPSGLQRYLPQYRYLVIDEGSYREQELAELKNLRHSFAIWIKRALLRDRMGDPDYEKAQDLVEVQAMLEKQLKQWQEEWTMKGKLKGINAGKRKGKLETARGLILHGVELDIIAASTGFSREELEKLRRDMES